MWSLPLSSMSQRGTVVSECATYPMSRRPASFHLFAMLSKLVRLSALMGILPTTPYRRTDIGIISSFCRPAIVQPTCRCQQSILSLACSSAGFWEHTRVPSMAHICRPTSKSTRSVSTDATRTGVVCSFTAYSSRLWSPPRNLTRQSWASNDLLYVVDGTAKWRPHMNYIKHPLMLLALRVYQS